MKYLFNNKKKVLLILLILVLTVFAFYYIYTNSVNHDTLMIKEKYEKLNHVKVSEDSNYTYQNVFIERNAPLKNITVKDAVKMLKEDSGILFIGKSDSPESRNALPILLDVAFAMDEEVKYLDAFTLRDEYKVIEGEVKKTKKASKYYYQMLELLDDYLDEYVISDNNKQYDTNEKRIEIPLVVVVKDGIIEGVHAMTVELNEKENPYDLLTNDQKDELTNIYYDLVEKINSNMCTSRGC